MSWRHGGDEMPDGRPKRDLVVRMIARLGRYDYVFGWVFQTDGTLRVAVGLTGIAQVKMVAERNAHEKPRGASRADAYGRFIAEHIVATNHDHFFSFVSTSTSMACRTVSCAIASRRSSCSALSRGAACGWSSSPWHNASRMRSRR